MKANLLYRGQDAEHGYVWMEFAPDGHRRRRRARRAETVTLVIGLSAHKNMERARPSFFSRTSGWASISACCPPTPGR